MTYPVSFIRHQMLFSLPGGEIASVGCSWSSSGGIVSLSEAEIDSVHAKGAALWSTIKAAYAPTTIFTGSKISWIGLDGRAAQTWERPVTGGVGTGGTPGLPTQIAIVGSLYTANAGRRGRGRMYLPAPNANQLTSSGRLLATQTAFFGDALAAYLSGTVATSAKACVMSNVGEGLRSVITSVKVGDVLDTQRRRRDNLPEVYDVSPVT